MRWLKQNWMVVLLVLLAYLWFNGTLKTLLTPRLTTPTASTDPTIFYDQGITTGG